MDDETNSDERPGAENDGADEPPFQDLIERIRASDDSADISEGGISNDSYVDTSGLFEEETAEQFDSEALWKFIESDRRTAGDLSEFQEGDADHVVPKRWYCEQCEHFSEPPEVQCKHDDTTILEFVGTEEVRVRNCPVVVERKALGQFQSE